LTAAAAAAAATICTAAGAPPAVKGGLRIAFAGPVRGRR